MPDCSSVGRSLVEIAQGLITGLVIVDQKIGICIKFWRWQADSMDRRSEDDLTIRIFAVGL